jgi:hypothetical protein
METTVLTPEQVETWKKTRPEYFRNEQERKAKVAKEVKEAKLRRLLLNRNK